MVVVPIDVCVPDDIYQDILSGKLFLQGMVKDNDNKVRKHLPTIKRAVETGIQKTVSIIKNHKKETIIVTSAVALATGVGITFACLSKNKKKKEIQLFNDCLENYYSSIKQGILNIQIIDNLLNSLNSLEEKNIVINIPATQLSSIICSIYDYTLKLAEANDFNIKSADIIQKPNNIVDLKKHLGIQKDIIRAA